MIMIELLSIIDLFSIVNIFTNYLKLLNLQDYPAQLNQMRLFNDLLMYINLF